MSYSTRPRRGPYHDLPKKKKRKFAKARSPRERKLEVELAGVQARLNDSIQHRIAEANSRTARERSTSAELEAAHTRVWELSKPIPMLLWCPECGHRHIDEGVFATKSHHTHACQGCGLVWRPAIAATTGVQFLPGFKNGDAATPPTPALVVPVKTPTAAYVRELLTEKKP